MPVITRRIPDNPRARQTEGSRLPSTLKETMGATFDDPTLSPTELASTQRELRRLDPEDDRIRSSFLGVDVTQQIRDLTEEREPPVDPEKLNAEFGELGLNFDRPVPRSYAQVLAKAKREEAIRNDIISRGPTGVVPSTLRFGAALAGAALDPLNVASAFVPVVGQARYAGWVARFGKTRARMATGFIEGSVGNAAVEVPVFGLTQAQQLDYTMSDALLNVSLGGFLGGGLHAIGGKMGDLISSRSPKVREQAHRTSVAQMAESKRPDVEPVFRLDEATFRPIERTGEPVKDRPQDVIGGFRAELEEVSSAKLEASEVKILSDEVKDLQTRVEKAQETIRRGDSPEQVSEARAELEALRGPLEAARGRLERHERATKAESELSRLDESIRKGDEPKEVLQQSIRRVQEDIPDIDVERFRGEFTVSQEGVTRPMTFDQARLEAAAIARREAAPERDITVDPEAAARSTETIEAKIGSDAESEAAFAEEGVEALRAAGLLTKAEEAELDELAQFVDRAESYELGVKAAARCLSR